MELLEGITTRKTCRAFKATPISKETIDHILETASKSPSYTNSQPWEVTVVIGKKKDELSRILYEMAQSDTPTNPDLSTPKEWPPEIDKRTKDHHARRYIVIGVEPDNEQQKRELGLLNFKFYGAPCVLFLFIDRSLTSWSIFDMGLFAQNIILAAHSLGLGSCLQASIAGYPDTVRDFLGISKTKLLVLGISIGYPDLDASINTYKSARVSPRDFVGWYE